jgi:NAD(P)-dependent dehydrogenase (short-subunit alcohol dehydrogenase family)
MKLEGKVALVTGTSPNIGGGIAEGLADEGAKLVCVDIVSDNALQCAEHLTRRGAQAIGIVCDITDEAQVQAAVEQAAGAFGGIDILVNNAGILGGAGVLDMPLEQWNRQIAVNLTGTFLVTKYVARQMVAQGRGGSIIVIISTAGHQGQAAHSHGPYRGRRTRRRLGSAAARAPFGRHARLSPCHPAGRAAQPSPLWPRRRLSRLGRCGNDHRIRPAGGRWRHRQVLAVGAAGG